MFRVLVQWLLLYMCAVPSAGQSWLNTACASALEYYPTSCSKDISTTLPNLYVDYCVPNDAIIWKSGVTDGSIVATASMIDFEFLLCQTKTFSNCTYIELNDASSEDCGESVSETGVMIGAAIDLAQHTDDSLIALGASVLTRERLAGFLGVKGDAAAEAICSVGNPMIIGDAFQVSLNYLTQQAQQVQALYEAERNQSSSTEFMQLPLGVRTVMTDVYMRWANSAYFSAFWSQMTANNFAEAITKLRSWYSNGATDEQLAAAANILAAALGCSGESSSIDIVFLVDESGSVGSTHFQLFLEWMVAFIKYFSESALVSRNVRFGVSTFSTYVRHHFYLDSHSTVDAYEAGILSINYGGGGTILGGALLNMASSQFSESNGMRAASHGAARVLLAMTDGRSSDNVAQAAQSLRDNRFVNILAIAVDGYDVDQLRQVADDDNIYFVNSFTDLDVILSGITSDTCLVPTQLDTQSNAVVHNVEVHTYESHYFSISISTNSNVVFNITQSVGCIYVYISASVLYPSYFSHDVSYTSCAQLSKHIVFASTTSVVYVGIEGRSDEANNTYDMSIDECLQSDCEAGTNYNEELDSDDPYAITTVTCNEDCGPTSSTIKFSISLEFSDDIMYNVEHIECFLYDAIGSQLSSTLVSFDSCALSVSSVSGGQERSDSTFCSVPPCIVSSKGRRRRLLSSACEDSNDSVGVSMEVYAETYVDSIAEHVESRDVYVESALRDLFDDSFGVCVEPIVLAQLLTASPTKKPTKKPTYDDDGGACEDDDEGVTTDTQGVEDEQPPFTQMPLFAVSVMLAVCILLWTFFHFFCNGQGFALCTEHQTGEIADIRAFIEWDGRNKCMIYLGVGLIGWTVVDIFIDLVTTIGIFSVVGNPNVNDNLYIWCGLWYFLSHVFSLFLLFGQYHLFKLWCPQINELRATKLKIETEIRGMSHFERNSDAHSEKYWEYFDLQKKIGAYLGHFIMYGLLSVALEDCIQVTVTWYIKNDQDLYFGGGWLSVWLLLTFIASVLLILFKLFRALLLQLGCHHDSYDTSLKPDGISSQVELRVRVPSSVNLMGKKLRIADYRPVPLSNISADAPQNFGINFAAPLVSCGQMTSNAVAAYEGKFREAVKQEHEKQAVDWGLCQLVHVNKNRVRIKLQQAAEDSVLELKNEGLVKSIHSSGVVCHEWTVMKEKHLSPRDRYEKLSVLERAVMDQYTRHTNDVSEEQKYTELQPVLSVSRSSFVSQSQHGEIEQQWKNQLEGTVSAPFLEDISRRYEMDVSEWVYEQLAVDEETKKMLIEKAKSNVAEREVTRFLELIKNKKDITMSFGDVSGDHQKCHMALVRMIPEIGVCFGKVE